ncbi:MAG: Cro/Cl family transcriptional regulator [Pseudomonadaceae bacterium]|nr:Cro/Cl family transcriptional regulator [Pseudomonadaceae bacterium]
MHATPLADFVKEKGQAGAAKSLGVTQGAISKALRVGRYILVTCKKDGTCEAKELRPFPSQATPKKSAA